MKKFFKFKRNKHGSIYIRIDELEPDHFNVDVSSSCFFITRQLEEGFKNVLQNYLTYIDTRNN